MKKIRAFLLKINSSSYKDYLLGEVISKGSDLITIILVSFIMTTEDYGYISVAYSIIPILIVVLSLNIPTALIRKYFDNVDDFNEFVFTNLIFLVTYSVFGTLVLLIFSHQISNLLQIPRALFVSILIVSFLRGLFEYYKSLLHAKEQSRKYSNLTIIYHIILNALFILFIFIFPKSSLSKTYADIFITSLIVIYIIISLKPFYQSKIKLKHIKYSLLFSLPLIAQTVSNVILGQIDRIMINSFVGIKEAGIYSFAYNIGMIISIIIVAVNRAWLPYFYKNSKNTQLLIQPVKNLASSLMILAILISAFSPLLLQLILNNDFNQALHLIPVIVLGNLIIFFYVIYSNYFFFYKKTYLVSINTIISSILNVILNFIMIPKYGFGIASITTLISYMTLFLLHYITVKVLLKNNSISIKNIMLPLIIAFITTWIIQIVHQTDLIYIAKIIILLIIVVVNIYIMILTKHLNIRNLIKRSE